jgi:hypothetical protein
MRMFVGGVEACERRTRSQSVEREIRCYTLMFKLNFFDIASGELFYLVIYLSQKTEVIRQGSVNQSFKLVFRNQFSALSCF